MAKMLYVGTHGPDDPTRATFPFHFANGALEAGFTAKILLVGDAVLLMKEGIADAIQGVGVPKLTELMKKTVAGGAEVHI